MALPRVLLVEDDASIRRLVELSLDGMPIELITCSDAAQARANLLAEPVVLLITDLMMPGESGADLVQSLAGDPALRGGARLVVFSAGITPELQRTLTALGVWRFLPKPASMDALEACVVDALGLDRPGVPARGAGLDPCGDAAAVDVEEPDHQVAIARHFAGDAALFHAFRATCLTQFSEDLRDGDRAAHDGDAPALRRLAHSLKSVLRTLGCDAAADGASQLEAAAAAGDWTAAAAPWAALRATLIDLSRDGVSGA
ncbi:MAG: response regulator [Rhizobacter sp.]